MVHKLKIHPLPFQAWIDGYKRSEFRKNDRKFKVGDTVELHEWDPKKKKYTGKALRSEILHIDDSVKYGIPKGYAVLCMSGRMVIHKDKVKPS